MNPDYDNKWFFAELIVTQWDVNLGVFDSDGHYEEELIVTQWDVNDNTEVDGYTPRKN